MFLSGTKAINPKEHFSAKLGFKFYTSDFLDA
jgi:hypothetical protein